ncbi:MAG: hypothetical protein LBD79_07320 [Treponema sp.]|nr:hypothetical protein [Treponema sp.]
MQNLDLPAEDFDLPVQNLDLPAEDFDLPVQNLDLPAKDLVTLDKARYTHLILISKERYNEWKALLRFYRSGVSRME